MREVVLLGSTGSIGRQTLDVIRGRRDGFRVVAMAAGGSDLGLLARQAAEFAPTLLAVSESSAHDELRDELRRAGAPDVDVVCGPRAAAELAAGRGDELVVNAITGAAGLEPTIQALRAGRVVALANKESLVVGGRLVATLAAPGQLVPVDSEHSALAQALRGGRESEVSRLILTASGGPCRGMGRDQLERVTPRQALAHPTWQMGRVITINSATLVNKGLEVLEASLLFGVGLDRIDVVVHPQSIVHSMVEFVDGSTLAQCSAPDMRLPIGLALSWPERLPGATTPLDWTRASDWRFEPLDDDAFPAVRLARSAGEAAGTAPAVMNAANEVCVDAFCASRLSFTGIVETVARCLDEHLADGHVRDDDLTLEAVLAADAWARKAAAKACAEVAS